MCLSAEVSRGNLDPLQVVDNLIELDWQREAPPFRSDFNVYIWEYHKTLPVSQRVRIQLLRKRHGSEARILMLFRYSRSMHLFKKLLLEHNASPPLHHDNNDQVWSPDSEVFYSICVTFQVMICEMTDFLQGCSRELENMVRLVLFVGVAT